MLLERMIRAARLDPELYNEVEQDQTATGQAVAVVLIVAVCALLGSALAGHHTQGLIGAGFSAVIAWLFTSLIILVVGKALGGTSDFGEVMRTLAFAYSPGVFQILTFFPLLGPLVGLVVAVWTFATTVVAVREAMDFDTGKAVLTVLIPFILLIGLIFVGILLATSMGIALAGLLGR
jgi:hypothetical protein